MRIWKSTDGNVWINLDSVCNVFDLRGGFLLVYTADGGEAIEIDSDDAQSLRAALDAVSQPVPSQPRLDDALARLNALRHDMGTVGGNALVEIVRDIVLQLTEGR